MTKTTKTETALRNCRCSIYTAVVAEITDEHGEMIDITEISTGCTQTTRNDFAQGHDAKLKSFLIAAGVQGLEVARVEGGLRISNDALGMAQEYGFAHMVRDGIAKGQELAAKRQAAADRKHEAAAAKLAKKAGKGKKVSLAKAPVDKLADAKITVTHPAPSDLPINGASNQPIGDAPVVSRETEPLPVPVAAKAKVGRWTYEGTVNVDGSFTYNAKLGGTKTAQAGSFTVLDA